jgi:hypothetical protein
LRANRKTIRHLDGLAAALLAVSLVACGLIDNWSGVSDAKELQQTGLPARATILEIWDTGMTINNDPVIGLRIEVTPDGRPPYIATIKKALILSARCSPVSARKSDSRSRRSDGPTTRGDRFLRRQVVAARSRASVPALMAIIRA